jgi:hypothetical protein
MAFRKTIKKLDHKVRNEHVPLTQVGSGSHHNYTSMAPSLQD